MSDDRAILRELAGRVREIASLPVMDQRRKEWRRHNALRPGRPLVLCFPEGAWCELLPDLALRCADPVHRAFERQLRSKIIQHELVDDDNSIEPWLDVSWKVHRGACGFDIPFIHGDNRGSYVWKAPMTDLERDVERLVPRPLSVDREGTRRELDRANELFGDILPARIHGGLWWTVGLTQEAAFLAGMEGLMWAMVDAPAAVHRLMAFLRDDMMRYLDFCEREKLLTRNDSDADYCGSGGVGAVDGLNARDDAPVTCNQMWGFAEAQETVGISPTMFEEFVLPYQAPILERFALAAYGCCEQLETRIDCVMKAVPHLRRVSVAPAANQEKLGEALVARAIFSRKPQPGHVCVGFNEKAIRADIRRTLAAARGGNIELILKDTHTIQNEPQRLKRWVQIAREEIEENA